MLEEQTMYIPREEDIETFIAHLHQQEKAHATIEKYRTDLQTFFRFTGTEEMIDKNKILEYKEWLSQNYAISSANSMIAALNSFLDYKDLSALKIRNFRVQRKLFMEKELTAEEYKDLVKTAAASGNIQLALIMESICATGIRVSELRYFTIASLKKGKIEVTNKGKNRIILLPDILVKKLLCYAGKQGIVDGPIFVTNKGNPKDRSNIWSEMKSVAEKAGIDLKKVFPHNLRHLFARTFYKQTKNLAALADLLGHGSLEVTRIYTMESIERYRGMMNQLELVTEAAGMGWEENRCTT